MIKGNSVTVYGILAQSYTIGLSEDLKAVKMVTFADPFSTI